MPLLQLSDTQIGIIFRAADSRARSSQPAMGGSLMTRPIGITDSQLQMIMRACEPLLPIDRDAFLRALANRLSGEPELGDGRSGGRRRSITRRRIPRAGSASRSRELGRPRKDAQKPGLEIDPVS